MCYNNQHIIVTTDVLQYPTWHSAQYVVMTNMLGLYVDDADPLSLMRSLVDDADPLSLMRSLVDDADPLSLMRSLVDDADPLRLRVGRRRRCAPVPAEHIPAHMSMHMSTPLAQM